MRPDGFTLIELMIVIAIISIVAAIAIPSLVRSKDSTDEAWAIGYIHLWHIAQEMYRQRYDIYADDDTVLIAEQLISVGLRADGTAHGYQFDFENVSATQWQGFARPLDASRGLRSFYITEEGVTRYALGADPDDESPPVGN